MPAWLSTSWKWPAFHAARKATNASPEKMKKVSIIQSAMTHFDWLLSGASCASASSGDGERSEQHDD